MHFSFNANVFLGFSSHSFRFRLIPDNFRAKVLPKTCSFSLCTNYKFIGRHSPYSSPLSSPSLSLLPLYETAFLFVEKRREFSLLYNYVLKYSPSIQSVTARTHSSKLQASPSAHSHPCIPLIRLYIHTNPLRSNSPGMSSQQRPTPDSDEAPSFTLPNDRAQPDVAYTSLNPVFVFSGLPSTVYRLSSVHQSSSSSSSSLTVDRPEPISSPSTTSSTSSQLLSLLPRKRQHRLLTGSKGQRKEDPGDDSDLGEEGGPVRSHKPTLKGRDEASHLRRGERLVGTRPNHIPLSQTTKNER